MKQIYAAVPAALLACVFGAHVQAQDIRDQMNIQTGKAELVIADMEPGAVANQIKEAISQFAIPVSLNYRSQPSEIPARPDEPVPKQVFIQGAAAIEYQCPTAYAEIVKSPAPVNNRLAYVKEFMQVCLYRFQKGTKAYVIFTRGRKTESLTSGLFNGITNAIQGTDGERIAGQLQENITAIRKNIPTVLVERVEVPGMPLQEPDKAAVAALIPAKSATVALQLAAPVLGAAPQLGAPTSANAQQSKIEARKNLTAMGMTYHSTEQFFAAIRRKDDVAVHLFLEADGMALTSLDALGKTPLDAANEVGAVDVATLITAKIASKNAPLTSPAPGATKPAVSAAAGLSQEQLTKLNAAIDASNLPAEQKEAFRANAIRQMQAINALVSQSDQKTGQLR